MAYLKFSPNNKRPSLRTTAGATRAENFLQGWFTKAASYSLQKKLWSQDQYLDSSLTIRSKHCGAVAFPAHGTDEVCCVIVAVFPRQWI